jgi:hypothetical protein
MNSEYYERIEVTQPEDAKEKKSITDRQMQFLRSSLLDLFKGKKLKSITIDEETWAKHRFSTERMIFKSMIWTLEGTTWTSQEPPNTTWIALEEKGKREYLFVKIQHDYTTLKKRTGLALEKTSKNPTFYAVYTKDDYFIVRATLYSLKVSKKEYYRCDGIRGLAKLIQDLTS